MSLSRKAWLRLSTLCVAIALLGLAVIVKADGPDVRPEAAVDTHTPEVLPSQPPDLAAIAKAASGIAGEPLPPCPSVEEVDLLKAAGIEFGPCDPLPEDGQTAIYDPTPTPEKSQKRRASCVMLQGSKGSPELNTALDCAVGAEFISYEPVPQGELLCLSVTYVPRRAADQITETLCPGERPSTGGVPMGQLDNYRLVDGVWTAL